MGAGGGAVGCDNARNWGQGVVQLVVAKQGIWGRGRRRLCSSLLQCKELGAGGGEGDCGNARNWWAGGGAVRCGNARNWVAGGGAVGCGNARNWELVLVKVVESLCYNAEGTLDIVIDITITNTLWPWGRLSL